ncbi:ankyrin repeat domain-containing protein [Vibrio sp. 05-20-BW147]|uniref:ankyrin repeat domain-containing protein n=1 Tax=Vibrio sp. 05-20-BW147 TaxID=2575834 RepID=UPI001592C7D3|nr:ankyrin repeat domain-containing protein [Vibrio sp. 05-20-BW147]NVC62383.1 ankyrin repeat domain-containing protein [Vibrio sp. 05-20-BW147]
MFKKIFLLLLLLSPVCALAEQTVYDRMLEKAVKENDLAKAEEMIKKGGTLNNASYHILIQKNKPSLQMAKLFNKYKLKLARTENSSCLLGDVIDYDLKEKDLELVKYFVEIGEDLDCYYNSNRTGKVSGSLINRLFYFQKSPNQIELKAIEYVLISGAKRNINKYYLRDDFHMGLVYTKGHSWKQMPYNAFDLMVKHGLDLSEPYAFKSKDKNGIYDEPYYIPHLIINDQRKDKFTFDLVKRSIKSGLDINAVDRRGWTMLDYAHNAKFDELEIYLLENGGKYANFSNLNSNG